ncbi:MAG TPA: S41 family peptidase [Bacteroidota bacterium]
MIGTGRWKYAVTAGIIVVLSTISLGMWSMGDSDLMFKIYNGVDTFSKVYKEIALNYVDQVDPQKFMRAGIDGMLKTLDPYTVFIGENEGDELDLVTNGKYAGVGITIGLRDGAVTVLNLVEGYSAAKQGIQVGDRILEVDGKSMVGAKPDDVRALVRGEAGTEVKMKIAREGEPKPVEYVLLREIIPVKNVTYAGYVGGGIGYIRLERFSRTAADDVRNAIKELQGKGDLKGIVLDLRDNPGGLLDIAVSVVADFVPENSLVVSTRGRRNESDRKYYSTESPLVPNVPLAVLVDRGSASASEIVAGAIQDLDRGIIVGERSFGKGLVQTITRISETSSVKVTTARYYTPSGRCIQEIDYSHRTKDGVFATFPDSLKRVFRTSHKRIVLEGGGIEPDSTVADEEVGKVIDELVRKAMFFKFANTYAVTHKSLPEDFQVSDDLLKDFETFLKDKKFEYQEDSEVKLKELRDIAEKERYKKEFLDDVTRLNTMIEGEKERKIQRYEKEMRNYLRAEIEGRINGERAEIESTLPDDRQLNVAVSLLKNNRTYDKLLAVTPGKNSKKEE